MKNNIFKVIDRNIDSIIEKKYYLCKVNFGDLVKFVENQFKGIDFEKFNYDFCEFIKNDYYENDNESVEDKNKRLGDVGKLKFDNFNYENYFNERREYFRQKDVVDEKIVMNKFIFNNGIENGFISLYFDNFNGENYEGNFYLLDGYRRILFNLEDENLDREVYVKIYDGTTSDVDLMRVMFGFNFWKIPMGVKVWFDRGWRLFLFKRLGIELGKFHFNYLNVYLDKYNYGEKDYIEQEKLVTGNQFYNDMKIIDYLVNSEKMNFSQGYYFNEVFIYKLSKIRLNGNNNKLNIEDWIHFFDLSYGKVNVIKKMSVKGRYIKHISALVDDFFDNIWMNSDKLEKMRIKKPEGKMEVSIEDFIYNSMIRNDHNLSIVGEDSIVINNNFYKYQNNKIYAKIGGFQGNVMSRVYLFFDKFYVMKYNGKFYILSDKEKLNVNLIGYNCQENNESVIFFGDKEGVIEKVKQMTGEIWKPNMRKTDFMM